MGTVLKFVSGLAIIFFAIIASTLMAAFGAWCIGLVFGTTITDLLAQITGIQTTMWSLGAFVGFFRGLLWNR